MHTEHDAPLTSQRAQHRLSLGLLPTGHSQGGVLHQGSHHHACTTMMVRFLTISNHAPRQSLVNSTLFQNHADTVSETAVQVNIATAAGSDSWHTVAQATSAQQLQAEHSVLKRRDMHL